MSRMATEAALGLTPLGGHRQRGPDGPRRGVPNASTAVARKFTAEFKDEAVRLVSDSGRPIPRWPETSG